MIKKYHHVMNPWEYRFAGTKRTYRAMRQRKQELRSQGYRVKHLKNADGYFDIFIKDVTRIGKQRNQGNGRVMV